MIRATVLVSFALTAVLAQQPAEVGRVEGVVVDSLTGDPISAVEVSLDAPDQTGRSTTTDSAGWFALADVPPGLHVLYTSRAGYLPVRPEGRRIPRVPLPRRPAAAPPYATSGVDGGFYGIPVTVGAGQAVSGVIPLMRRPVVVGRVLDTAGEPVRDIAVVSFLTTYDEFTGEVRVHDLNGETTNDLGEFRFDGLEPGGYGFRVVPTTLGPGRVAARYYLPTWYPGTQDPGSAGTVDVESGEIRLRDMFLASQSGARLFLEVTSDGTWPVDGPVSVSLRPVGQTDPLRAGMVRAGELVEVGELPGGAYDVTAQFRGPSGASAARRRVDLAAADTNVRLVLPAPSTVIGRVVDASDGEGVRGVRAELMPIERSLPVQRFVSDENGILGRPGPGVPLAPGSYLVTITTMPEGMYLAGIEVNGRDAPDEPVQLRSGEIGEIFIGLASPTGRLTGTIVDGLGRVASGAIVVLAPEDADRRQAFAATVADAAGAFEIEHAPGSYRLYAWSELNGPAYRNATFMSRYEEYGIPVQIEPGGEVTAEIAVLDGID